MTDEEALVISKETNVKLGTVIAILSSLATLLIGGTFMYANIMSSQADFLTRREYYEQNQKLVTKEDLRLFTDELGRRIAELEKKVDRITNGGSNGR